MPQLEAQLSLEKSRVRDLLRYYTPKKVATQDHGSFLDIDCHDDVLVPTIPGAAEVLATKEDNGDTVQVCDGPLSIPATQIAEADDEIPDDSELLSHDPTLMAFTQLGAFRLNCQRSFISLMDGKHQYIIAEATRSVSINNPDDYDISDPGEKIYLGARMLDMQWGVCPNTIQVFTALDDSLELSTDVITANKQCYVMNDLSAIAAYANRPYVSGWPHMRFYAEVPIYSPAGYVIGTYCVVDDKPRDGLSKDGLKALNEISGAIMNHLALARSQIKLQRAEEMVRGLGRFVEGKSSSQDRRDITLDATSRPALRPVGTAQTVSTETINKTPLRESTSTPLRESTSASTPESPSDHKSAAARSASSSQRGGSAFGLRSRERKLSVEDILQGRESLASTGTKVLFARACDLIREAIDLVGTILIDASFRDIAVDPPGVSRTAVPEFRRSNDLPDTPETEPSEWLENDTIAATNISLSFGGSPLNRPSVATHRRAGLSDVLAYSLQEGAGIGGFTSSSSRQVTLPQSTVRGLLRYYRQGHIFFFDEDGTLAQNTEELRAQTTQKDIVLGDERHLEIDARQEMEQAWAKDLIKICVGARAIIFFPLWDPQRDQWFAGGLAWTNDPTRILQPEDITYLSAFGSCIMAEKSRLDALVADRAKADFISSVSHELRSPLHGVLASAEALKETSTGLAQDDMIRTITVCGEFLLDTMDQILDYAKMSNSANLDSKNGKQVARKAESPVVKTSSLDLSNLVETVVEGILAGHTYRKAALVPNPDQKKSSNQNSATFSTSSGDIIVILSIDWQASWIFESQTAGWKRILINLFGNSLKYTDGGFVHISLRASRTPGTSNSVSQTMVTLQIDDSGRGMSEDYMKYDLYTPFAQEDHMSVGTGLGLSIVKQLVKDLGGTIEVRSEKGCGTSVKVTARLGDSDSPEPELLENGSMIADIKTRCKGLTLCLIGFEYYPDIGDTPTGILTAHGQRMLALKASITGFAVDWFDMNITAASSLQSAYGDILIGLQSKLEFSEESRANRPLMVFEDVTPTHLDNKGLFSLSQPVGPHKMARILGECLEYISSARKLEATEETPILPQHIDPPSSDLMGSVEDIDQKTTHDLEKLSNANQSTEQSLSTNSSPLKSSTYPAPTLNGITQQMELTDLESMPEIPPRSRVLLVEDNIINMKILMNYMKKAKHQFVTAVNGLEALEHYQAAPQSFKVIFMDISMPVMDGLTSTRKIRIHERENSLPRTRVVALTCFSSPEYQRDAFLSGIDLFLIKPVPMKTLGPILESDPNVVTPDPV